jgi:hypothetical protein
MTDQKKDILIVAKTYPEISRKYTETVCTAGILAENKSFVRLYPVRFRYLEGDHQFRKYQWIKAKIVKSHRDSRPESYNIDERSIELGEIIPTKDKWQEREKWVLNSNTVYPSLEAIQNSQERNTTSLGIIKPKKILGFHIQKKAEVDLQQLSAKKDSIINQLDMFEQKKDLFLLPVKFMLHFLCDDPVCTGHKLSVLDWEFGQLYRRERHKPHWEDQIKKKVSEICSDKREVFLILGNMASRRHTFCILGLFYPPQIRQMGLFR